MLKNNEETAVHKRLDWAGVIWQKNNAILRILKDIPFLQAINKSMKCCRYVSLHR